MSKSGKPYGRNEEKTPYKRRISNFLIRKDIQLRITLTTLFWVFFSSLITGVIVFLSVWPLISDFVPHELMIQLNESILIRLLLMGIPMIIILALASIVTSHRIAGPIYQIEKILDMVIQGKKDVMIHLREGDLFPELARKVNRLIENLRGGRQEDGQKEKEG